MYDAVNPKEVAELIFKKYSGKKPKIALITGSGLGALADAIENPTMIPYKELPGFFNCSVSGHSGELYLGELAGVPVACMKGRVHYYEGIENATIQHMIYTLRALGCETLIASNAAGSFRAEVGPGQLVMISDHINLQFRNPLVGANNSEFGPRFVGMSDAYDPIMRAQFIAIAKAMGMEMTEGVYLGVLGPTFETPAEIRAFKLLGADLVGMSTVADTIVARHCGMKVAVVSTVTNLAAGMTDTLLSHEETLAGAALGVKSCVELIVAYIKKHGATLV